MRCLRVDVRHKYSTRGTEFTARSSPFMACPDLSGAAKSSGDSSPGGQSPRGWTDSR